MKINFRLIPGPKIRRFSIALISLTACGYVGAADEDCFENGFLREALMSKPNVAVVMRIDGGLSDPGYYVSRAFLEPEMYWREFGDEYDENFSRENRFDYFSEFLVLKSIKGDLGPVIVFYGRTVNRMIADLGKLLLIGFGDPRPDGNYDFVFDLSYDRMFPQGTSLTKNSNSRNESGEFELALSCRTTISTLD